MSIKMDHKLRGELTVAADYVLRGPPTNFEMLRDDSFGKHFDTLEHQARLLAKFTEAVLQDTESPNAR